MRRLALAVLSLAFLAACQPGVAPLTDEDITALNDIRTAYVETTLAGGCDAHAALYAENAVLLAQNESTVEGREAIKAACEAAEVPQDFTLTALEIDGYGDLAFDRGTWTWTGAAADTVEAATLTGKYVTILRKQADGSWLVTVDMWNSDAPLPQPEPEPEES
jgi:ketosteroid isomerase-like protein